MHQKKKQQLKREAKNFSITGIIATAIDYAILNILSLVFHVPVLPANIVSTTTSSVASYIMNRKIVFTGRRHSMKTTITLYVVITAVGIYIIQNAVIFAVSNLIDALDLHLSHGVELNIAKVIASLIAGVWNYMMLRYFVFIPETKQDAVKAAE